MRAAAAAGALLAALLAASCALAPTAALMTPSQLSQWDGYVKNLKAVSVGPKTAGSALDPVLTYQFSTPLEAVQSSNSYTGSNNRLRRVVTDLLAGKPVKVVAIGGVATNGSDASRPGTNDYFASYVAYLTRAFPAASVKAVRASAGLAPSSVVAACSDRYLPADADLVVLEMTASDGAGMDSSIVNPIQPKAYEVLVRKILGGKSQPALLMLQTIPPGMGNTTRPFYLTPESPQYAAVSGYYNVPVLSMRNALWPGGELTATGRMSTAAVTADDGSTPEDEGHSALADSLVFLTQRTAMDLQVLPFGEWDTKSLTSDVPKPMFNGVDNPGPALRAGACNWVTNNSVSATGGCPSDLSQMCGLDWSSWDGLRRSYAAGVTEVLPGGESSKTGAIIGGVVGGVVGGLAIIGGLIAFAIIRQKRRAAAEEEAYSSKFGSALPITASTTAESS